ncbi:hypothetical protein K2173_003336 [Erythroxylum novogranatense]|uniref:LHY n=1 Tax=Erythroxylum novogranatense TaxID=1862640 RepID=A0AAV8S8R9_9ROSI|nr:hypothetical protein K2173_003336 [Erythroxylum novogranatense]
MDTYSSGEELVIKTRKPYTITKQRERWTEEEHNRFLEALKLYGRAWQRIEEHIGTKTAVQIRSHAQKFFSKLEKEATAKGIPVGQTLDIDIPPPRPKRKPNNPYPRKTGSSPTTTHLGGKDRKFFNSVALQHGKQVLDLEKEPQPEKSDGDEKQTNLKQNQIENCSEVFTHGQETHHSSMSSVNKNCPETEASRNSCFREFIPSLKKMNSMVNENAMDESYVTIEDECNRKLDKPDTKRSVQENVTVEALKFGSSCALHVKLVQGKEPHNLISALPTDENQVIQNYPRHVPVQVVDNHLGPCMQAPVSEMTFQDSVFQPVGESHTHPNIYLQPAASATTENRSNTPDSCMHQPFPTFPPPFTSSPDNQDDYRSFLHISSTFSSLIVSTLLQNPAAQASASFAATFWPYANIESSADSPTCGQGGLPSRQLNPAPNMAAIAAATVAAATAWWAAHGLPPLCAPLHASFTCPPGSATAVPPLSTGQVPATRIEKGETIADNPPSQDQLEPQHTEALQAQNLASKSPGSSSSDSEESGASKVIKVGSKGADHENTAIAHEIHDSSKTKNRKQVDRSSCGSNTTSSSEVETDALEKHEKGKEEPKEADPNHPAAESIGRRSRSGSSTSDSWKEVSEEGRLAFQALFSREVLPQSFSPPHDIKSMGYQDNDEKEITSLKDGGGLLLDISSKTRVPSSGQQEAEKNIASSRCESNEEQGLLTIGLGHGKLKARRTGFKPYKRCSVEAKENKVMTTCGQGEEKGPKRIRLEGEASR